MWPFYNIIKSNINYEKAEEFPQVVGYVNRQFGDCCMDNDLNDNESDFGLIIMTVTQYSLYLD